MIYIPSVKPKQHRTIKDGRFREKQEKLIEDSGFVLMNYCTYAILVKNKSIFGMV